MAAPIRPVLRSRVIAGNGRLPPLRVDELMAASRAANDDGPSLCVTLLAIGLMIGVAIALGVAAFTLGRGW